MNLFLLSFIIHYGTLTVSSEGFNHYIPSKYTCEGAGVNPPLAISGLPENTRSLVLIIDEPEASGGDFVHWLVWNIPPCGDISENCIPGTIGKNSLGSIAYVGPCPAFGKHRFCFTILALNTLLNLPNGADKEMVEKAADGHILARGVLTALYEK